MSELVNKFPYYNETSISGSGAGETDTQSWSYSVDRKLSRLVITTDANVDSVTIKINDNQIYESISASENVVIDMDLYNPVDGVVPVEEIEVTLVSSSAGAGSVTIKEYGLIG